MNEGFFKYLLALPSDIRDDLFFKTKINQTCKAYYNPHSLSRIQKSNTTIPTREEIKKYLKSENSGCIVFMRSDTESCVMLDTQRSKYSSPIYNNDTMILLRRKSKRFRISYGRVDFSFGGRKYSISPGEVYLLPSHLKVILKSRNVLYNSEFVRYYFVTVMIMLSLLMALFNPQKAFYRIVSYLVLSLQDMSIPITQEQLKNIESVKDSFISVLIKK